MSGYVDMQLQLHRSGVGRASFVLLGSFAAVVLLCCYCGWCLLLLLWWSSPTAILQYCAPLRLRGCWLLGPPGAWPAGVTSYTENSLPPRRGRGFVVKKEENTEIKEKKTVSAPPLTPEQRRNGNTPRWTPTLRHNNGRGRRGREGQRELS